MYLADLDVENDFEKERSIVSINGSDFWGVGPIEYESILGLALCLLWAFMFRLMYGLSIYFNQAMISGVINLPMV
ncbi:unnamed protein product [Citrullus colocynthis]|uniref:Uncharacterized protein n=1 Tax=Citrullus colocynthis TaxID=252529 RepID=A0ABP0YAU8_9ROSI